MRRRSTAVALTAVALGCTALWWLPAGRTDPAPAAVKAAPRTCSAERTRHALDQVVDLEFTNYSLEQVLDFLRGRTGLNFFLDTTVLPALKTRLGDNALLSLGGGMGGPIPTPLDTPLEMAQVGKTVDLPRGLTCKLRGLKLRTALEILLGHYDLGYAILGDTVLVSSAEQARSRQLEQPVDVDVDGVLLTEALQALSRRTGTDVVLDESAVKRQARVSLRLRDVPLTRAVSLLVASADLRAVPVGKVLVVTTEKRAAALQAEAQAKQAAEALKGAELLKGLGLPFGITQPIPGTPLGPCNPTGLFPFTAPPQDPGPAPRCGEESAPQEAKGAGKSEQGKKVGAPKQPAASKSIPQAQILEKLAEPMNVTEEALTTRHALRDTLNFLNDRSDFTVPVLVDEAAFKAENPDAPDLYETQVKLPRLKGVPRGKVLRMLLDQLPTQNATYLVRRGYILVTTYEGAAPERQSVQGVFRKRSLEEVLQELSEQSGVSIVLDNRIAAKGSTLMTATFQPGTSLVNAVRLLADMADLKAEVVDNVVYVTLRSNGAGFPSIPPPGKRRAEAGV